MTMHVQIIQPGATASSSAARRWSTGFLSESTTRSSALHTMYTRYLQEGGVKESIPNSHSACATTAAVGVLNSSSRLIS